jgi:hypothetical protein
LVSAQNDPIRSFRGRGRTRGNQPKAASALDHVQWFLCLASHRAWW